MVIVSRMMTVFLHVISLLDIEKANDDLCDYGLDCDKYDFANKIVYDALSSSLVKVQIFISFPIWQNSWLSIFYILPNTTKFLTSYQTSSWWRWLSSFVFQKPWPKDIRHVKVDNIRITTKHFQFWVKMTFDALRHYKKLNT